MSGAEKLLGAGDMLFMSGDMGKPVRLQSPYITEEEVKRVVSYLKKNYEGDVGSDLELTLGNGASGDGALEDDVDDDLYEEARITVIRAGKASTSYLQRKLRVGYARAARIMDILEERGVIGPADGSRPRDVLIKDTSVGAAGHEEDDAYFSAP